MADRYETPVSRRRLQLLCESLFMASEGKWFVPLSARLSSELARRPRCCKERREALLLLSDESVSTVTHDTGLGSGSGSMGHSFGCGPAVGVADSLCWSVGALPWAFSSPSTLSAPRTEAIFHT